MRKSGFAWKPTNSVLAAGLASGAKRISSASVGSEGVDADRPLAGADLGLHPSLIVHGHWDLAFDQRKFPVLRQDRTELLLAASAGDGQLDLGVQPKRDAVLDHPVDLHRQTVFVGGLRAQTSQPDIPLGIPIRNGYRLALDDQGDNADLLRNRNSLGHLVPLEVAGQLVKARRQLHRGNAVALHDRNQIGAGADIRWPILTASRQRHPRFLEHADVDAPGASTRIGRERQS